LVLVLEMVVLECFRWKHGQKLLGIKSSKMTKLEAFTTMLKYGTFHKDFGCPNDIAYSRDFA